MKHIIYIKVLICTIVAHLLPFSLSYGINTLYGPNYAQQAQARYKHISRTNDISPRQNLLLPYKRFSIDRPASGPNQQVPISNVDRWRSDQSTRRVGLLNSPRRSFSVPNARSIYERPLLPYVVQDRPENSLTLQKPTVVSYRKRLIPGSNTRLSNTVSDAPKSINTISQRPAEPTQSESNHNVQQSSLWSGVHNQHHSFSRFRSSRVEDETQLTNLIQRIRIPNITQGPTANGLLIRRKSNFPSGLAFHEQQFSEANSMEKTTIQVDSCSSCFKNELCLRGRCVCPVAYQVERGCQIPRPEMKGCAGVLKGEWLATKARLQDMANFTTCAVVGSGNIPVGARDLLAQRIDQHSAVFRFNEAPTKGTFGDRVGRKTTIRLQNRDHCGFNEGKGEICMYSSMAVANTNGNQRCVAAIKKSKCRGVLPSMEARKYAASYWRSHSRPNEYTSQVRICSSAEMALKNRARTALKSKKGNPCKTPKISSGFFGILLAAQLCAEVNVFLFDHTAGHYYRKVVFGSNAFRDRHQWTAERICQLEVLGSLPGLVFQRF